MLVIAIRIYAADEEILSFIQQGVVAWLDFCFQLCKIYYCRRSPYSRHSLQKKHSNMANEFPIERENYLLFFARHTRLHSRLVSTKTKFNFLRNKCLAFSI